MLPAWILTYLYKGKTYVYAVNGQTGKAHGDLPIDNKKLNLTGLLVGWACSLCFCWEVRSYGNQASHPHCSDLDAGHRRCPDAACGFNGSGGKRLVVDQADVLTWEQEQELGRSGGNRFGL